MVGEGGNLGCTQRGRIEYALGGGRIYTDFIDNSAGVDCSDHEVNIKILLNGAVADGELALPDRDELLAEMTDEVAELVLRDNYDQARALGNSPAQAASLLPVHRRMIDELERSRPARPGAGGAAVRRGAGGAHASRADRAGVRGAARVRQDRAGAGDPHRRPGRRGVDRPRCWSNYFPTPLRERFADRMAEHRLRREIVTTVLVNEAVNRGGISFVFRAVEETGGLARPT